MEGKVLCQAEDHQEGALRAGGISLQSRRTDSLCRGGYKRIVQLNKLPTPARHLTGGGLPMCGIWGWIHVQIHSTGSPAIHSNPVPVKVGVEWGHSPRHKWKCITLLVYRDGPS